MFGRILIANRGEIAVRIMRTCRRLGVESVAVYSDADRRALHVLEADRAVHIGPSPPAESYLNIEAIVRAALESGAEAVHPGYGLLSENAAFAQACLDAGLVFIGPAPNAIAAMGDKAAARRLVASRGVPVVPGYDGDDQDPQSLLERAQEIGFPVMIKAASGGGGRGMRLLETPEKFMSAVESARREAQRSFGDGRLILERAILGARHIEIQVLADQHGSIVHLGERDCSIQRRHQKVIEETPSPVIDPDLRWRVGEAAVEAGRSVDYSNAGTVEFLFDADRNFYFLEMNTRLQVEHGVTELITGLDLVALQLRIAAAEPLPFSGEELRFRGHAIECRIYAEDPAKDYLPSAGRITVFEPPSGPGIRNDVGTYAGDEISTYYDPMLAKMLTWGEDRPAALERMQEALAAYRVEGVRTNLDLLRAVVTHPIFQRGEATTDFLQQQLSPEAIGGVTEEALLAAFGAIVLGIGSGPAHPEISKDPWLAAGPWRAGGSRLIQLELGSKVHTLAGRREAGTADHWNVQVGRKKHAVRFVRAVDGAVIIETNGASRASRVRRIDGDIEVSSGGHVYRFSPAHQEEVHPHAESHREKGLVAPMPGLVLRVLVKEGDRVRTHQPLVVLEAMKMEHSVEAPHNGVVRKVHCAEGGRVSEGQLLVELEEA